MNTTNKVVAGVVATTITLGLVLNEVKILREIESVKTDIISNEIDIDKLQNEIEKNDRLSVELDDTNLKLKLLEDNMCSTLESYEKEMNKKAIYNPDNVGILSDVPTTKLEKILKGTSLEGLGYAYKQAEKEYGVNALFLIGLTAHESGWGTSRRAKENNNLSGYGVYNNKSEGTSFRTKFDCIMRTAKLIRQDYLNKEGKNHKGVSVASISKMYVNGNDEVDNHWVNSINSIANDIKIQLNK